MIPINKNISPAEQKRIDDIAFFCKCIGTLLLIVTTIYTIWNLQSNVKIPPGSSPFFSLEWWVQGLKGLAIQLALTLSFVVILLMPRGKYKAGFTGLLCVGMLLSLFGTISYNQKKTAEAINSETISESEYLRLEEEYYQLMDTNEQLKLGVIAISGTSDTRKIDTENADDVAFRDLMLKKNETALLNVKEKMKIYENKGKNKSVVNAAFAGIGKLFGLKNKEDILRLLVHLGYAIFLDFGALLLLGIGPILRKLYHINSPHDASQRLIGASTQKIIPKLPSSPDNPPSPFSPPPKGKGRNNFLNDIKSKLSQKLSQFNPPPKKATQSQLELDHIFTKPTPPLSSSLKDPSSDTLSHLKNLLNTLPSSTFSRIDPNLLTQNSDSKAESDEFCHSRKNGNLPEQNLDLPAESDPDAPSRKNSALPKQNLEPIDDSRQNSASRMESILPEQNEPPSAKPDSIETKKPLSLEAARRKKAEKGRGEGKYDELMRAWDAMSPDEQSLRLLHVVNRVLNDFVKTMYLENKPKDGHLRGYKSTAKRLGIKERIGQECHYILKELGLIEPGKNPQGQKYSYPVGGMTKEEMIEKLRRTGSTVEIRRGGTR